MSKNTVVLIPGDGTGPEIVQAMRRVVEASGADLEWEEHLAGEAAMDKHGTPLPDETLAAIERHQVVFKAPLTTPVGSGFRSINVALRKHFDLFANLRPVLSVEGIQTCHEHLDLHVVRENTEGLYAGIEHYVGEHAGESIRIITREGTRRVARFAFDLAQRFGRKKVTIVHKANILKVTDGIFLEESRKVAEDFPDIECEDRIVDNMAMQLVLKPWLYDVLLCPNLYGDIISDLCAGLVGGLGMAPGANIGEQCAMFEAVHGSAPKYAGQDKVNPTAVIMAAALMLDHLEQPDPARRVREAVQAVIREGRTVTYDLGGSAGTQAMAAAMVDAMA
jgi:isocitrate dehydrogenase (NAD+)